MLKGEAHGFSSLDHSTLSTPGLKRVRRGGRSCTKQFSNASQLSYESLNPDTVYLETMSDAAVESSVPQDCPHFRYPLQVPVVTCASDHLPLLEFENLLE